MNRYSLFRQEDLIVVRPEGEIDSRSYPELENKLMEVMSPRHKVIFNMQNVDFMDSKGVVFMLRMREVVEINGSYFAIYNVSENVGKILRRLQIEKILNVCGDVEKCFGKILEYDDGKNQAPLIPLKGMNSEPISIAVCLAVA
jgi:anti-anti-sigma factor